MADRPAAALDHGAEQRRQVRRLRLGQDRGGGCVGEQSEIRIGAGDVPFPFGPVEQADRRGGGRFQGLDGALALPAQAQRQAGRVEVALRRVEIGGVEDAGGGLLGLKQGVAGQRGEVRSVAFQFQFDLARRLHAVARSPLAVGTPPAAGLPLRWTRSPTVSCPSSAAGTVRRDRQGGPRGRDHKHSRRDRSRVAEFRIRTHPIRWTSGPVLVKIPRSFATRARRRSATERHRLAAWDSRDVSGEWPCRS